VVNLPYAMIPLASSEGCTNLTIAQLYQYGLSLSQGDRTVEQADQLINQQPVQLT
jgi:hypothetical protein